MLHAVSAVNHFSLASTSPGPSLDICTYGVMMGAQRAPHNAIELVKFISIQVAARPRRPNTRDL